jgi:hypothetical protein
MVDGAMSIAQQMMNFYIFAFGTAWDAGIRGTGLPSELVRIGTPTWSEFGGAPGAGVTGTADYFETLQQGPAPGIPGSGGGVSFVLAIYNDTAAANDFHVWSSRRSATAYTGFSLRSLNAGANYRAQYGDGVGFGIGNRRSIDGSITVALKAITIVGASIRGATDMSLYVNGVKDTGTAFTGTGGAVSNGTNLPVRFGGNGQNLNGFTGQFMWVASWNRSLSDAEHMEFYLEPFECIQRRRVPYSFPAAVGTDAATVYINIQAVVTEEFPVVPLDIEASGVETKEAADAATVYIDIRNTGGECFSSFSSLYLGEGEAFTEFNSAFMVAEFSSEAEADFNYGDPQLEGVTC